MCLKKKPNVAHKFSQHFLSSGFFLSVKYQFTVIASQMNSEAPSRKPWVQIISTRTMSPKIEGSMMCSSIYLSWEIARIKILAASTTMEIMVKRMLSTNRDKLFKKHILAILKTYWKCLNFPLSLIMMAIMVSRVNTRMHPTMRVGMDWDAAHSSCFCLLISGITPPKYLMKKIALANPSKMKKAGMMM